MKNLYKIFVFCPTTHTDQVIDAMAQEGAGVIGKYTHCAYITKGTGSWFPQKGAKPYIGKVGKLSKESEDKIEMVCPKDKLDTVIKAIQRVHPYEEPEVDVMEIQFYSK